MNGNAVFVQQLKVTNEALSQPFRLIVQIDFSISLLPGFGKVGR